MAMLIEVPQLCGYKTYQNKTCTMDSVDGQFNTKRGTEKGGSGGLVNVRPVSALARGVQITEFAESRVNPTPLLLEESDILLEQYLSPGKLQRLTGVDSLETVESLELKVDSSETSLGNFGFMLPNLTELKLSGSTISCVRDLGSSLRKLHVLWLTRCGLEELDGISSMLNLAELYLEYNEVVDLSPLSMLENLEILDLEGNNIEDVTQVQYLSLCPKLKRLALDGNPICVSPSPTHDESGYDYHQTIKKMLPNLLVLDDERLDEVPSSLSKHNVFDDDWAYLEELQKDAFLQGEFEQGEDDVASMSVQGDRPTTAALRPATSYRIGSALRPSSGFRPLSASRRLKTMSGPNTPTQPGTGAALRPVSSDALEGGIESSSELTIGGVICGNPSKALRQRRAGGPGSKNDIRKGLSKLMQKGAVFKHSEDAEDVPFKAEDEMNSIIEELNSWKVEHERRMKVILKSKEAQVLVVDHDEVVNIDGMIDSDIDTDLDLDREEHCPVTSQQRHRADVRLKTNKGKVTQPAMQKSQGEDIYQRYPRKESTGNRARGCSSELRSPVSEIRFQENFSSEVIRDYDKRFERPFSAASLNSCQRLVSHDEGMGDVRSDREGSGVHRPISRGQGEAGLAPLRAPSPTSAQIINSMRSRQQQELPTSSSSTRSRKLRIGPTGLPVLAQQPVIKNNIAPLPSRSVMVPTGAKTQTSRSNVPLLPSQPRIHQQLPETPSLLPHPPKKS